jgi:hypothetical protein
MSKVVVRSAAQPQYISAPRKIVVLLLKSQVDVLQALAAKPFDIVQPDCRMSITACEALQQAQRFDISVLVQSVSAFKVIGSDRRVADILVIDCNAADQDIVNDMTISFWTGAQASTADTIVLQLLEECRNSKQPVTFFALQGQKRGSGFKIQSTNATVVRKAVGARAEDLSIHADRIMLQDAAHRTSLPSGYSAGSSAWQGLEAKETFCCFLQALSNVASASEFVPETTTLWQLNWCHIAWPQSETVLRAGGDRIWFSTTVEDATGKITAWMDEDSALALSVLSSKESFVENHDACRNLFPIVATAQILRSVDVEGERVHFRVVECDQQPLDKKPSRATHALMEYLHSVQVPPFLPASFDHLLSDGGVYPFVVSLPGAQGTTSAAIHLPCQRALGIIKSDQLTKETSIHGEGWLLETQGVRDAWFDDEDAPASRAVFSVKTLCSPGQATQFKLDPPRGRATYALVMASSRNGKDYYLEHIHVLLTETEVTHARQSLRALQGLALAQHSRGQKRELEYTPSKSPWTDTKRCRTLGGAPSTPI